MQYHQHNFTHNPIRKHHELRGSVNTEWRTQKQLISTNALSFLDNILLGESDTHGGALSPLHMGTGGKHWKRSCEHRKVNPVSARWKRK